MEKIVPLSRKVSLLILVAVYDTHILLRSPHGGKVTCYSDDIVIWHTGRDIVGLEIILQKSLTGIGRWTKSLKLKVITEENHI